MTISADGVFELDTRKIAELRHEERVHEYLRANLKPGRGVSFVHRLDGFHRTKSSIAYHDFEICVYLEAIGSSCGTGASWEVSERENFENFLTAEFEISDPSPLIRFILDVALPKWRGDAFDCIDPIYDLSLEIIEQIRTNSVKFYYPDAIDDAMASYLDGALDEELCLREGEPWPSDLPPEWRIGFWISAHFASNGIYALTSGRGTIYLPNCDSLDSLEAYARALIPSAALEPVVLVVDPETAFFYLVADGAVFELNHQLAHEAIHDISRCMQQPFDGLITAETTRVCVRAQMLYLRFKGYGIACQIERCDVRSTSPVVQLLLPPLIEIDWSKITDDEFETIAYDFLDSRGFTSIRKMGKSRSSDGGRDLTAERAPLESFKYWATVPWICQCKKVPNGTTAYTSRWGEISDTVLGFGAKGYVAFTNGEIDSKMHDKLDRLKSRGHLEDFVIYSCHEVERFISERPHRFKSYLDRMHAK